MIYSRIKVETSKEPLLVFTLKLSSFGSLFSLNYINPAAFPEFFYTRSTHSDSNLTSESSWFSVNSRMLLITALLTYLVVALSSVPASNAGRNLHLGDDYHVPLPAPFVPVNLTLQPSPQKRWSPGPGGSTDCDKAVCKGHLLLKMMAGTDSEAGQLLTPPIASARSRFQSISGMYPLASIKCKYQVSTGD